MGVNIGDAVLAEIRARAPISEIIGQYVELKPGQNNEFEGCCPFHDEKTASFTVVDNKKFYHCFGCGAHGDAIRFLIEINAWTFPQAVKEVAIFAGMESRDGEAPTITKKPMVTLDPEKQKKDRERKIYNAKRIWSDAKPAQGTLVEDYLKNRGLDLEKLGGVPPTLRYHPRLRYTEITKGVKKDYGFFPAMVAQVVMIEDGHPRIVGVHRTFLTRPSFQKQPLVEGVLKAFPGATVMKGEEFVQVPDPITKADLPEPKKVLGPSWGGCIRLAPAAPILGICEGIETGLSVQQVDGLPVWVAGSAGAMAALILPDTVKELVLYIDNDNKKPAKARELTEKIIEAHESNGLTVHLVAAERGMDHNDMLNKYGDEDRFFVLPDGGKD